MSNSVYMYTTMSYLDLSVMSNDHCTVIIHICCEVMLYTLALLPNFDFYLCLRVKFHKSLFWVPILAAGGPYFTKKWVPIGSLSQSLGVLISLGVSAYGLMIPKWPLLCCVVKCTLKAGSEIEPAMQVESFCYLNVAQ